MTCRGKMAGISWSANGRWIGIVIFGGTGLACLLGSFLWLRRSFRILRTWKAASGRVTGYVEATSKRKRSFRVEIEFENQSGERIRFVSSAGFPYRPYYVGARVPVRYPESNPAGADLVSIATLWAGPIVIAAMGVCLLMIVLYLGQ